jgi:uncharacterized protein (TIGR03435 family)
LGAWQSPNTTRFEEASVRRCDEASKAPEGARGGGPNSLVMTPGHFYMECITMATVVRTAYGYGPAALDVRQTREMPKQDPATRNAMRLGPVYGLGVEDGVRVRGGPDWVRSDRYTIEAVADAAATADDMRGPMLRDLLERRLQLTLHVDSEQLPGFALLVADGGVKTLTPRRDGDCSADPVPDRIKSERERRGWSGPVLIAEAAALGIKSSCGGIYGESSGPNMRWEYLGQPPGAVAGAAALAMGVRVIDRTGTTGTYQFVFEFAPDDTTPDALRGIGQLKTWNPKPGFDAPMTAPKAPSLLAALAAIGLKLEPIKVPREYLVIDRIERPTAN